MADAGGDEEDGRANAVYAPHGYQTLALVNVTQNLLPELALGEFLENKSALVIYELLAAPKLAQALLNAPSSRPKIEAYRFMGTLAECKGRAAVFVKR